MISSRGPNHVLVLDRVGIKITEVCDFVLDAVDAEQVSKKFPINEEEIFECIDALVDSYGPSENDFLELSVSKNPVSDELDVTTKGVSDWVFLSAVSYGRVMNPSSSLFRELYGNALEQIVVDCLFDISTDVANYENSELHKIVFDSFVDVYGPVSKEKAIELLNIVNKAKS